MANAEIIQAIRKEIERLYNDKSYSEDRWDIGYDCACEDMMSFLIDLEKSEKPMNPDRDLNKEINRFREIFKNECDARIVGEIANHFAQWGAEHLKK